MSKRSRYGPITKRNCEKKSFSGLSLLCCSKVRGIVLDYNLQRLATTYGSFKSLEVEYLSTYSLSALFQAKLQLTYSVCKWDLSSDGQVRFWALSFILRSLQVQLTAVYSFCQLSVSFWGHLKSFQVAFSWRWTSLGLGLKLYCKNELQCIFQELWATFTKLPKRITRISPPVATSYKLRCFGRLTFTKRV